MSTLEVKLYRINPQPLFGTDRLSTVRVEGYTAIVGRDQFKSDDLAIFVPYDAVIPDNICEWLKQSSKIEVHGGRIRCAKIRGVFSDGLCLSPEKWLALKDIVEGKDVTELLGIVKYEPPAQSNRLGGGLKSKGIDRNYKNDNFKHYTDIDNIKKNMDEFQTGEEVVATIKFHGSNARFGYVARLAKSYNTWERVRRWFGFKIDACEELVGSHNTIRKPGKKGNPIEDTFHAVNNKYGITKIAKKMSDNNMGEDVIIFGELVGPGIQKGYEYGIDVGEHGIRVFDIMVDGQYLNWDCVVARCSEYGLPIVDAAYRGPWSLDVLMLAGGTDEYNGKKYIREGVVIKTAAERKDRHGSRAIYKAINPAYLLDKTNSDNH